MIVTIDGPAGTGKSTVARQLADRLGFEFLNTGAMYRAVALACLRRGVDPAADAAADAVAAQLSIRFAHHRLLLNDEDVTEAIRQPEVSHAASQVAAIPAVRARLVELQRGAAEGIDLVTEGRDQGTVVFPEAECKFFLTASPEERALRRQRELAEQGQDIQLEEILQQQTERDDRDLNRTVAPLKPAIDAELLDTSHMPLAEVLDHLERRVRAVRP
ncbi:MAG TPA: (d)CMP kinase [Planctomycetaceae bacterium]|nr:(d)CMP kinase [Planctomycetaceae bacterium]